VCRCKEEVEEQLTKFKKQYTRNIFHTKCGREMCVTFCKFFLLQITSCSNGND
jgi:hypothetical protein